jgi:hypothetical protein
MTARLPDAERERFQILLTGAVDAELSQEQQAEFERYLKEYPECQTEWEQYAKLKEVTQTMKFKTPSQEIWDAYWLNVYNRIERGIAWIILSIGCIILLTYGGFKAIETLIADPQLETIIKVGLIAVIGGLVILVVSVVREKLFTARTDKYQKEVQR